MSGHTQIKDPNGEAIILPYTISKKEVQLAVYGISGKEYRLITYRGTQQVDFTITYSKGHWIQLDKNNRVILKANRIYELLLSIYTLEDVVKKNKNLAALVV
ncbi:MULTISPECIES: hypothetical protein [Olivibacter]|jgi:hypothetical protein|uniref:Uncharacterized protein n=1 Tax=Olivibacter oleidegradans TaxID=760123 RepID=A0ABV6HH54_9SPHI|nr:MULTISPECIES: hypothetical protein [Olivibacter]MDM8176896.1 hypothetical protein [Olivibacter sp. 47]MDX3912966.1 hypothetical protein [Pseudosphingobacterium sp.]QEL00660.1 hypothetical protein FKG96_07495 [Olivibacter sp. LS-1]